MSSIEFLQHALAVKNRSVSSAQTIKHTHTHIRTAIIRMGSLTSRNRQLLHFNYQFIQINLIDCKDKAACECLGLVAQQQEMKKS